MKDGDVKYVDVFRVARGKDELQTVVRIVLEGKVHASNDLSMIKEK